MQGRKKAKKVTTEFRKASSKRRRFQPTAANMSPIGVALGAFQKSQTVIRARGMVRKSRSVILLKQGGKSTTILLVLATYIYCQSAQPVEGVRITNFRVPAYVPMSLTGGSPGGELAKPILLDCDYQYEAGEDARLAVRWFRNKESEPFYQWLPELEERHFADWIRPLINESFETEPHEPMKRYRSLLIKRLTLELSGQYSCLVSSLASQDTRQASMVVYQAPRAFTFEHRIFPAPAGAAPSIEGVAPGAQLRPTQFRGALVRPANNGPPATPPHGSQSEQQLQGEESEPASEAPGKLVYTHDGRPIRRKSRRALGTPSPVALGPRPAAPPPYALQLHQLQCQALQVSPRPVIVLSVKRDADSIAQYLHESSSVAIRPHQAPTGSGVSGGGGGGGQQLYDITVSATIALNVSLASPFEWATGSGGSGGGGGASSADSLPPATPPQVLKLNTVLGYRRGQRMSFDCHLEITGTEFEQRKRININEEEVFKFAEAEEQRARLRAAQAKRQLLLHHQAAQLQNQEQLRNFRAQFEFSANGEPQLQLQQQQQQQQSNGANARTAPHFESTIGKWILVLASLSILFMLEP